MKNLYKIALLFLLVITISACGSESPLSEDKAKAFLESQGYTEVAMLGKIDVDGNCTKSLHEEGYKFQAAFVWIDVRTRYVEGIVCGRITDGIAIWSSAAGEMAIDLPEDMVDKIDSLP